MAETISPDYLVIGAGAMGMAFVDTLITDTKATVVMIDRYGRPGGHWTIVYPFVRLHQPSTFYGVNSRPLGDDKIDQVGLNKGLVELATADEVCAYYSKVMDQTFLPSGRVQYYAKHEYMGGGTFRSIITNQVTRVGQNTCIVDATYMKVTVPAMNPPSYGVSKDVSLIPPNDLPKMDRPYGGYTVIGAGKTGIDSCLWLLANGVDPKKISWIVPRDPWFFERSGLQPGPAFAQSSFARFASVGEATIAASSTEDLFRRLEACGHLLRLDDAVWPTTFRCATITVAELEQIKRVGTVIRQGRVKHVGVSEVRLEKGTYIPEPDTIYIDCTADGLAKLEPVPVFSGKHIKLQSLRYCQQVFSAALIAHMEATYDDESFKNELCRVVPHPNDPTDYLSVVLWTHQNTQRWLVQPKTAAWLQQSRLDLFGKLMSAAIQHPGDAERIQASMAAQGAAVCAKLQELM
ncbi:pyridine nucleotide-disulfide oxidoreductase-domain-containing protein [Paraphoma chrysanthemicola]|uniref:Pyridine nucleotide-disulfide oxidoreductase-domain-containing protein n=1 Tax=Paraphoma chrysanthemicola TaxID=798071 RepID=A0A8K0VV46_9PLEO|nr:pyridine nucleotide-disulfide oxidoreductase-domain-containing protein [Paraphoma chrysanthemicola]